MKEFKSKGISKIWWGRPHERKKNGGDTGKGV